MLCQRCGEREATIHEVVIRNGVPRETHLCEACAGQAGLSGITGPSVADLLPGLLAAGVAAAPGTGVAGAGGAGGASAPVRAQACDSCGMTFHDFKRTGLLGCSRCYEVFEDKVGPLLERAHEGGTHHVGKIPRRALAASREGATGHRLAAMLGDQRERAERLTQLRKQLENAVKGEQYERAAAIRDEMRRLSVLGVIGDEENGAGNGGGGEGSG